MNVLRLILLSTFILSSYSKRHYNGFKVLRLLPKTRQQLMFIQWLWEEREYELDFWIPPSEIGKPVDALVSPDVFRDLNDDLKERNISFRIQTRDLESAIRTEMDKPRLQYSSQLGKPPGLVEKFDLDKYNRYHENENYLMGLEANFPNRVLLQTVGLTHENRALYVVNIKGSPSRKAKPAIWIDGGIHAREWISPAVVLKFIDKLVTEYDTDAEIRELIDKIDWYIMPMVNPDGYEYTHREDRMWRKNRSPQTCATRFLWIEECCEGTDLNRNFGWKWASKGSSGNPCQDIYHGNSAFSEPETQALRDFVLSKSQQLKGFFTIHSYSQLWLLPFGHARREYPNDYDTDLLPISLKAAKEIERVHGTIYEVGTGADILYEAGGTSEDWAKGVAGIKFTQTLELRPRQTLFTNGFILPESQIAETAEETWAGVKVVAIEILQRYGDIESTTEPPVTTDLWKILSHSTTSSSVLSSSTTEEGVVVCVNWSRFCAWWQLFEEESCKRQRVQRACPKTCGLC